MPLTLNQTTKEVDLDLPSDIPDDIANDIKSDVGRYLVDAILDNVGSGKSPVSGYGSFAQLDKEYADSEKGGRRLPNLDLEGDMLGSLEYRETENGVEVGIWDSTQARKSFGHNTGFQGHPWLEGVAPERRFIPASDESFRREIQSGIKRIVQERLSELELSTVEESVNEPTDFRSSAEIVAELNNGVRVGTFSDIIEEDTIDGLIARALRRMRG